MNAHEENVAPAAVSVAAFAGTTMVCGGSGGGVGEGVAVGDCCVADWLGEDAVTHCALGAQPESRVRVATPSINRFRLTGPPTMNWHRFLHPVAPLR
jgi:hypothetical protein